MKPAKFIISLFLLGSAVAVTFASEITLSPATGSMGDGCNVAVAITADTNGKTIAATDVIMESSMEFVDFVPGNAFPYFLPPRVESTVVYIVGFAVEPSQRFVGKGLIGTAYFKKRSIGDRDGAIHLYFTKVGDTIDSNLSMAGGIDTLEQVNSAYYTFDGTGECIHEAGPVVGGIKNIPLDSVLQKISLDTSSKGFSPYIYLYRLGGLVLLIIGGVFYFAKARKGKKAV